MKRTCAPASNQPSIEGYGSFDAYNCVETTSARPPSARTWSWVLTVTLFLAGAVVAFLLSNLIFEVWASLIIAILLGLCVATSAHVAMQWEEAVVLRLGRLNRIVGPGLFLTIPIIENVVLHIDQRMRCTFFSGERILTADLVPVDVNAVFYWSVWDSRKASVEVEDYVFSVLSAAQASMRDVIGSMELEELATRRAHIDKEICDQIGSITEPWGISVITVRIRDIAVPLELQDALSKAAQAQRERDARVILAEVEKDISSMLVEAANEYDKNEHALQLRTIHAASDGIRDGGMVVVPSALGNSFGKAEEFLKQL